MSTEPHPSPTNPLPEPAVSARSTPPPTTPPAAPQQSLLQDPVRIAFITCALGIFGCFFAPWFTFHGGFSGYGIYQIGGKLALLPPGLAFAALLVNANERARRRVGPLTAVLSWFIIYWFADKTSFGSFFAMDWGAWLTLLFGVGLVACSGKRRFDISLDLAAKKLNSRKAEVFSHWGSVTPDIHFSTQDFYAKVEAAIRAKEWPGVQLLRVQYREAGLLSHSREYLRIIRQRQLFDVCAAGFGKDYFFSLREAEIPAVVDLQAFVALALTFLLLTVALIKLLGMLLGLLALVVLAAVGLWLLVNALKLGLTKIDSLLMTMPVIGPVYEAWFRRDTYFQQDTRLFFLHCVAELVKRHVAETTSANGVKLLNGFEKKPILGGLYQPFVMPLDPSR